jgi:hypothetical protein
MCSAAHLARKRSALRRLDFERLGGHGRIIPGRGKREQGILQDGQPRVVADARHMTAAPDATPKAMLTLIG